MNLEDNQADTGYLQRLGFSRQCLLGDSSELLPNLDVCTNNGTLT